MFFFFQAEDGIRDYKVTGVQTCALPISRRVLLMVLANLGSREPLERPGSGEAGERVRSPDGAGDGGALRRGARVHPDRRLRATQHAVQLSDERLPRIEPRQSPPRGAVPIKAARLLRPPPY